MPLMLPSTMCLQYDEAKRAAVASAVEDIQTLIACQRLPPKQPGGNFRGPSGAAPAYNFMPPPQQHMQGIVCALFAKVLGANSCFSFSVCVSAL